MGELSSRETTVAIPVAVPASNMSAPWRLRNLTKLWWLTILCLAMAVGLVGWSWFSRGILIRVEFRDGHGLRAENRLMRRGIEVGMIERIELSKNLEHVDAMIRLNDSASAISCEGSRFWIERPMASLQGVRGLETILSGRYIAVEPGPDSAKRSLHFKGLDDPPPMPIGPGVLEVVLEADDQHGLQVNAPVIYRGLEVGRVYSVGLSADSRWVQVRAVIDAAYRTLVRENSRFWNRSGLRLDVGLSGLEVDAESLATIAMGGIEFATPDMPAAEVKTGRRFEMTAQADSTWTKWRPRLLYGANYPPDLDVPLSPLRGSQHWQERLLGFRQSQSRQGWLLLLSDDTVLGPSDLLTIPPKAIEGSIRWEIDGVALGADDIQLAEPMESEAENDKTRPLTASRFRIQKLSTEVSGWPSARLLESFDFSRITSPVWIACGVPSQWIPVESHQLTVRNQESWSIQPNLGISQAHHGAPVFDRKTAKVIGLVIVDGRMATIQPLR